MFQSRAMPAADDLAEKGKGGVITAQDFFFVFVLFTVIQLHAEHSGCPPEEDPTSDSMRTGSRSQSHPSTELHQAPP